MERINRKRDKIRTGDGWDSVDKDINAQHPQ